MGGGPTLRERRGPRFSGNCGAYSKKTVGLIPTLAIALRPFENKIDCAFLYSSKARREECATSHVDLMIIGKVGSRPLAPPLAKVEKRLGQRVNVTNYSENEFRREVAEVDRFLTRQGRVFLLHASASGDIGLQF
jgi:hypothetical protein